MTPMFLRGWWRSEVPAVMTWAGSHDFCHETCEQDLHSGMPSLQVRAIDR